jgi:L-fuconolactonase
VIVDSHVHVASADTERYPTSPTGVGSDWWQGGAAGVEALLDAMNRARVDRAVVVQAVGAYGHDCRYAVDAVATAPERLALVGSVDLDQPDATDALRALATAGATGVRLFGVRDEPAWLTDGRATIVWQAAAELGLTVVPTLFDHHLPVLRPLLEAHPQVPVALDHCGFPDLAGGPPYAAAASLWALADLPSLHLKVSTHVLHQLEPGGDPADFVDALAAAFGAHRLCWGSDHPQTRDLDYVAMVALGAHAGRRLDDAGRVAFLAGTADRLWFERS